jgi:hypothetical protein
MDIFVYADESGVFDVKNNEYYVYGGVIFLSKNEKDNANRKYLNVEEKIREHYTQYSEMELKANVLDSKIKNKIFRSANECIKFGVVINQEKIRKEIFRQKKSKQRYLDYAFKIGLKNCFLELIKNNKLKQKEATNIFLFVDEHTTATDGKYELKESLLQEFKYGTFNMNYNKFYRPLFPNMENLNLQYCDSNKHALIRLSDIVANRLFGACFNEEFMNRNKEKVYIKFLP